VKKEEWGMKKGKGGMKMKQKLCVLSVLILITAANCVSNGSAVQGRQILSSDDPSYQYDMGERNLNEGNYERAAYWFRKAAEQGHAQAQNELGWLYDNGYGVEQDNTQAVFWYRKAAEQGNDEAQNNLGLCYIKGNGVEQDYTQANFLFRKAAEQGYADAVWALGILQP
jgi:TPR repeat protein